MQNLSDLPLYIGGEWRRTPEDLAIINPATEQQIGRVSRAEDSDLDDALSAAETGFQVWKKTPPRERADILLRAATLMRERQEDIALSITAEQGKPLPQARLEVIRGCEFLEWDAGEAVRSYGRVIPSARGVRYIVHREPVGVTLGLSPWNFPMSQPCRKVAGALAAGCSIILKAAEETPSGAVHIAHALHDAGLPKGVLNLVFGTPDHISKRLIAAPLVRLVAFTGSTAVGRHLTGLAACNDTAVLMELGGHAPVIVCQDTDVEQAAQSGALRKYRNAGQVCTSPTRFFVQDRIFEKFLASFVKAAAATVVGNGMEPGTEMGPLANERRVPALLDLIADARNKGAELQTGGTQIGNKGYFLEPTVLAHVPDDARLMHEEPFGPLAIINSFTNLDDAIARANAVPFGLAAYGFTNRADDIDQMTNDLEAGNLSFNTLEASLPETPFGGVKSSGFGREGGIEGLENYMIVKNVSHSMTIV